MWTDIIFPYAHASDALRIEFHEFTLDGEVVASADVMDTETNSISFFQMEKPWQPRLSGHSDGSRRGINGLSAQRPRHR